MPKPLLQAMVLADHVYRDAETGKFLIIGTFGNIQVRPQRRLPAAAASAPTEIEGEHRLIAPDEVAQAGSPYLYVALTGVHGTIALQLKYVDLSDSGVLMEAQIDVTANDPLTLAEFKVPLPPLPRKPGKFSLDLLYDDQILGSWRVGVSVEAQPNEPEQD